jgi:menaquinone-dependent protoporphyrinogen oxidase
MAGEVLVAFGTRHESTRGIAAAVADILRAAGIAVELVPVSTVGSLGHVRAAVLGSAVWDEEWLPGAYEFLVAHERDLAAIPTWLFASGPLEHVPVGVKSDVPDDLVDVIGRIGPRDVALFAGSLQPHHLASGLRLLSRLARTNVGDHRDWEAIERWANGIRDALLAEVPAVARRGWRPGEGS